QTFNVSLTVTDQTSQSVTVTNPVYIGRPLEVEFTDTKRMFNPFNNCNSFSSTFTVGLALINAPPACIDYYEIDWGDATPIETVATMPVIAGDNGIPHTYANRGIYTLTITIVGSNGCRVTKEYQVVHMTNASGGIDIPENAMGLCIPADILDFRITPAWFGNHIATTYTIDYGDGTVVTLTQAQMLLVQPDSGAYYPVPHIYTEPSCPNEYIIRLTLSNICGDIHLSMGVKVAIRPVSEFTGPDAACINTLVTFINDANPGYAPDCNRAAHYTWNFGDGTTVSTLAATPPPGTHTYTSPGTYEVTLVVGNDCGADTSSRVICIEPHNTLLFTPSPHAIGCAPMTISPENNTAYTSLCTTEAYTWLISYTAGECGTGSSYTYLGSNQNSKEPTIQFFTPGSYHIRLATDNVCMDTSGIQTITVVDKPTVSITPVTTCQTYPATSVSLNATVLNCAGSISYTWIAPGGLLSSSTVVSPTVEYSTIGVYPVNLTVENTCGSASSVGTMTINPTPSTFSIPDMVLCNGDDVAAIISESLAPDTPIYSWYNSNTAIGLGAAGLNGIPGFTATNTSAAPISGTVTVTPRINFCTGSTFSFTITVLPAPKGTVSGADTVCMNAPPVVITFTGSNGTPPYTFYYTFNGGSPQSISSGIGNTATLTVPTTVPGTFIYALDSIADLSVNGCVNLMNDTATVLVVTHAITVHPLVHQKICAGRHADTLRVSYSGPGTPTYQWYKNTINSNIGGTPIPSSNTANYVPPSSDFLSIGFYYYYVVLTFQYGNCHESLISDVAEVEVIEMPPIDLRPQSQAVCHNTAAETLEVIDNSGNLSFTYTWYDGYGTLVGTGATYHPPTNVVGTQYYYYIVNELYPVCSISSDTASVEVAALPSFSLQPQSQELCEGEAAPTLSIAYQDGTGTPNIQWYENSINFHSGTAISGAESGTYEPPVAEPGTTYYYCVVSFPDGNCGDITSDIAYVTVHPTPANTDIHITDVLCYGYATGAIALQNNPAHTYTWTGHNDYASNQQNINSLYAGTYELLIRSSEGCTYTDLYTITQPTDINISAGITPISCYNANDGIVDITISGGVAPYTVYWSDLTVYWCDLTTSAYKDNVIPGSYTVTIVDFNDCSKTISVNMVSPPLFDISPQIVPISCYGENDAGIYLNYAGGTAPISCVWNDDATAGANRIDLAPGTYSVTLTDSRLCSIQADFEIQEPMPLSVSAIVENAIDCIVDNSGYITLSVNGGTAPYSYTWSNGATTQNLTDLNAGNYWVDVVDSHGCTARGSYVVTRPPSITIELTARASVDCFDNAPAQAIIASVSGGTLPYTYNWSAGTVINAQGDSIVIGQNGGVILTVTDSRGCSAQQTFEVTIPQYEIVMTMRDCQSRTYDFDVTVDGEDLFIGGYHWDFGDGQTNTGQSQTHQYDHPGVYTVTLEQIVPGCVVTHTRQLLVHGPPNVNILPEDPRFCEGESLELTAAGAHRYVWNNGIEEQNLTVYSIGTYSVVGYSIYGCYREMEVEVGHFPFYDYRIQSDKKEVTRLAPSINFWTSDIFGSQYTWIFDDQTSSEQFFNVRHTYNVTQDRTHKINLSVINPHGCLEEDEMIIHANVVLINTFTPNGDGKNDVFKQGWAIEVYNRNGKLLYKGLDGWDGTYGGKPAAKDTYFYILYDEVETGNVKHKGYVTLLR
ncbi:MAG: PKD domain-containing protein, partial [Bacteroidales bacterium]|nr:PKD domain-containing protein [Bacteroidales bacterium]